MSSSSSPRGGASSPTDQPGRHDEEGGEADSRRDYRGMEADQHDPLPPPPPHVSTEQRHGGEAANEEQSHHHHQLGGYDDDEEEEEELMDEAHELALIREFGGHPLMSRVQDALYDQLHKTLVRLTGEQRELSEDLKRLKDKREVVGVELYGQQQQLARLQLTLEGTHNGLSTASQDRAAIEEDIVRLKAAYEGKTSELSDKSKQLASNQAELEALRETLRQVEAYNEEMKNEISITRRATYKVEQALQHLEGQKKGQDLYLDSLTAQVRARAEQLAAHEAQLAGQKDETSKADAVLRETSKEMETLRFERKQLVLHWKSSLVGLTRRDEALASAVEALREAEVSAKDYDMEIEGLKRELHKQQARNETLVSVRDRLESEGKFVDERQAKIKAEHHAIADRFGMLERSKEETAAEEQRLQQAALQLRQQIQALAQNLQVVTKERQAVEDEVEAHQNTQSSVNKTVRNLNKSAAAVVRRLHDKEMEIANVQNELARVQVDKLDTDAHVSQLRTTLTQLDQDLKVKDKLIEKYELEIRQRNDDIEKKMYRVDRLNKKYQQLMAAYEDDEPEAMGPLEASIKHLKREIGAAEEECLGLQKQWLDQQTSLVKCVSQSEAQAEKAAELKARVVILQQQQMRLLQELSASGDKSAALEGVTAALHKDIARMNEFIGKASRQATQLSTENVVVEKEFVEQLKALEHESAEAERKLRAMLQAKAKVLDEILETERQALLWEKKIELEKEAQAALDPQAGMAECGAMEREIHRMRIRLEALKREQERYLVEMERAIAKHEDIAIRNKQQQGAGGNTNKKPQAAASLMASRSNSTGSSKEGGLQMTNLGLRKRVKSLQTGLSTASKEAGELSLSLEDKTLRLQALTTHLERETGRYDQLEAGAAALQQDINSLLFTKQKQAGAVARTNTLIKYFQRVASLPVLEGAGSVQAEHSAAKQALSDLGAVLRQLQAHFPHLQDVIARVQELAQQHQGLIASE